MAVLQRTRDSRDVQRWSRSPPPSRSAVGAGGGATEGACCAGQGRAVLPGARLPHRAYAPNGVPFANGYVDYLKLVNAQGRHQRRQDHVRGMRDRLRDRPRRRVLRAAEGQGPDRRDGVPAAVHRHHVRADRQGADRQDSDHHRRLRPRRLGRRQGVPVELPAAGHLLERGRHPGAARRQEGRRARQAEGQEDRARLSRLTVRQGADRAAAGTRARCTASSCS